MKPYRVVLAVSVSALLLWGGYRAYEAHNDLVTLSVRNMDVRKVVRKIEWQTWESILVNKAVSGQVTLNVQKVPLEEVLNIIGLQTGTRWTRFYPIYSNRASVLAFNKVVRGDMGAEESHWSNFEKVPAWQRGGGGAFANTVRAGNNLVSAQFQNKDLDFAALALSRFSQARVVPEDNATAAINLKLEQAPFETAVAQVAKQAHRKWNRIYAIQSQQETTVARKTAPDAEGEKKISETNRLAVTKQENSVPTERELEAFQATMTPEERKKAQEQLATAKEIGTLPPAEQQQRMQDLAAQVSQASQANLEQRIQNRLKNGTPEQRVAHDRSMLHKQTP